MKITGGGFLQPHLRCPCLAENTILSLWHFECMHPLEREEVCVAGPLVGR